MNTSGHKSRAQFWRKLRNEFLTYNLLEEHHSLSVRWYGLTDTYRFKGSQESEKAFKSIADRAAQGLPKQPGREPWESWLDRLRGDGHFYRTGSKGVVRYSKQGLREVLKEGLAPVVKPVIDSGVLTERDCTEFPTERKPGDPYTHVDFTSVTGGIENVFEASARLCQELAGTRRVNRHPRMARRAKPVPATTRVRGNHEDTPVTQPADAALIDGKESVNFKTAEQYLGIGERQRQSLMENGALIVVGQGHHRKITTESLRRYRPRENPK